MEISKTMKIISLFSGAGGLDFGFEKAGFNIVWANEFDKEIWDTYHYNFPKTKLDTRSISLVDSSEIPDCDGIIGGPPCQSWSGAGSLRGIKDKRGKLFYDFIRILQNKKPKFFLAENVSGMLASRHSEALNNIKQMFTESEYTLYFKMLNASDFGIPQDRKRIFFIGIRNDINTTFNFPDSSLFKDKNLQDYIYNMPSPKSTTKEHINNLEIANHEYMLGSFSSIFMSRNRVRAWNEPSFTIQAGARHAPLHPQAPKMSCIETNKREFVKGKEHLYRRLSVRECARIQTFPDNHIFYYKNIVAGYKMVGNAVPCKLAYILAKQIQHTIK